MILAKVKKKHADFNFHVQFLFRNESDLVSSERKRKQEKQKGLRGEHQKSNIKNLTVNKTH